MESPLPQPSQLPSEPGQWLQVRAPVSQPTRENGDWTTYPHMSSKDLWKQLMGARAAQFLSFLEPFNIWPECMVCKAAGRGMRSDFGGHVAGQFHFKEVGRLLPNGTRVTDLRGNLWQESLVPGGAIRFNHVDGAIEMCKGQPDSSSPSIVAPGQLALAIPAAPVMGNAGPAEIPDIASLDREGQWIGVSGHIGEPIVKNGDFSQCPFFQSRNAWKSASATFPKKICNFLEKYDIYPQCPICPTAVGYEDHIPAQKHYMKLLEQLKPGEPIVQAVSRMWQKWNVPGGAVRLNHVHGRIELWRGPPPPESGEYLSLDGQAAAPPAWNQAPLALGEPSRPLAITAEPAAAMQLQIEPAPMAPQARFPNQLERADTWYQLGAPAAFPTRQGGNWSCYPHLQSRTTWRAAMVGPARLICGILENQRPPIWAECSICDRCRGFEEHLPADKHFRAVYDKYLKDGAPVDSVRDQAWQQWCIPGGAVRWNHIDGAVEMCRFGGSAAPPSSPPLALPSPCAAPDAAPFDPLKVVPPAKNPPAAGWEGYNAGNAASGYAASSYAPSGPPPGQPPAPSSRPHLRPPPPPPWEPEQELSTAPLEERGQSSGSDAVVAGKKEVPALYTWLWQEKFKDEAQKAEQLLLKYLPSNQLYCQACGKFMTEGVAAHLLSAEHMQNVAKVANPNEKAAFKQKFQLPDGREVVLEHFPLAVREEKSPFGSATNQEPEGIPGKKLHWTKVAPNKWQRSDGVNFVEGDEAWERFEDFSGKHYFWNQNNGNWFWTESGEDMGTWR